jgi:hypothetical protein
MATQRIADIDRAQNPGGGFGQGRRGIDPARTGRCIASTLPLLVRMFHTPAIAPCRLLGTAYHACHCERASTPKMARVVKAMNRQRIQVFPFLFVIARSPAGDEAIHANWIATAGAARLAMTNQRIGNRCSLAGTRECR